MKHRPGLLARYKLRLRRKRLLWRAFRKRHEIHALSRKTHLIGRDDILLFATVRNEALRLPYFLDHYRGLGVGHFLIVDNDSTDDTAAYLTIQPDVSLWTARASYKAARFGMDWLTCLLWRYGHQHWTVTVDADELLIYPDWEQRDLHHLTAWLDTQNVSAIGALMLELYPKGPITAQTYAAGQNPVTVLRWFDAFGYWAQIQPKLSNLWLQGGPRARVFFAHEPHLAPTLNKIPLVRWRKPYVYNNSTHNMLPARLNRTYETGSTDRPTGVLLHTKFLPDVSDRARIEKQRGEHFARPDAYSGYYDKLSEGPDFWHPEAHKYEGWEQLMRLRLMFGGAWHRD